jgi:hypothetical protein
LCIKFVEGDWIETDDENFNDSYEGTISLAFENGIDDR